MKYTVKIMLQGAGCFWIPDIVLHALTRGSFSGVQVRILTILLPIVCIGWWLFDRRGKQVVAAPIRSALTAVLGIWVFGPLAMTISSTFLGGGFSQPSGSLGLVGMGTILFPLYTFMMSTYDGTLGALLIVTLSLPVIGALSSRTQ